MNSNFILDFFKTITAHNIICAYQGDFNYEVINGILINIKNDLSKSKTDRRAAKKTYKVLVECLENIHQHANKLKKEGQTIHNEGIFILNNDQNGYNITVGNLINKNEKASLKQNFDQVNAMSKDQLKERYRKVISAARIPANRGPGLGIIDMALKSENKLNYTFYDYDDNLAFLTLEITIKY